MISLLYSFPKTLKPIQLFFALSSNLTETNVVFHLFGIDDIVLIEGIKFYFFIAQGDKHRADKEEQTRERESVE